MDNLKSPFLGFCLLILFSGFEATRLANPFPCSSIVVKEQQGVLSYLGNVTFTVPVSTTSDGWSAILTFDQQFTGVGVSEKYIFKQNNGN